MRIKSVNMCIHAKWPQSYPTLCDLIDLAHQAPLSVGFSRQEYWSGLPCPSPGNLPNPGLNPGLLHCKELQGSPCGTIWYPKFQRWSFSSVQFSCPVMSDSLQPHGLQHARLPCPSPIPGICSNSCLSVMPSNNLILWCLLLLLPSIFPSIRIFSRKSILHIRWPKYWSFSISPFNEYSGLISFRIDSFDLFAVQGTLKNLAVQGTLMMIIKWLEIGFCLR